MRTVVVIGRKGGSGKSTIAANLAIGFHLRGSRTVLVDIDPQRSSIEIFNGRTETQPTVIASSASKLFTLQIAQVREGVDAMVVDTPAVLEEDIAQAVVLADLATLVVRPTFLDLVAAAHTSNIIRRLQKPGLVIMNQAPPARGGIEPPAVTRAIEALRQLRLPVAPTIIHARAAYQTVLEVGRSAEEQVAENSSAREMGALCDFIHHLVFAQRGVIFRSDNEGG